MTPFQLKNEDCFQHADIECVLFLQIKVTNHMVGGEGGTSKPALGESWKTVPHVRLLLSHDHGSNFCNISILKHTCMVRYLRNLNCLLIQVIIIVAISHLSSIG